MLREVVLRFFDNIIYAIRRTTSVFNLAGGQVKKLLKALTTATKKPSQKEDYIETKGMFISKSFIVVGILGIAAIVVLWITLIQPFLVSKFFVRKAWQEEQRLEEYNGKVLVYYDKGKKQPRFEGRLKEGKAEGQGKQWDEDGSVIFEGNYEQSLRNGTGKLYENQKLLYEGSFKEDLYDGDGKLYNGDNGLIYSGKFTEGIYDGTGELYYEDGKKQYSGSFTKGVYNGSGTIYFDNEDNTILYKGGIVEGKYDGNGELYYEDGNKQYTGNFSEGIYNGNGTLFSDNEENTPLYKGTFVEGIYEGSGELYYGSGRKQYTGTFSGGKYNGSGTVFEDNVNNTCLYKGNIVNGEYDGSGELFENGQTIYLGGWSEGLKDGKGKEYENGELIFSGEFSEGLRSGTGKEYENGKLIYSGDWAEGKRTGNGDIYEDGQLIYSGELADGVYNGEGTLYYPNGDLCYKGAFEKGDFSGEGDYITADGIEIAGTFNGKTAEGTAVCYIDKKKFYDGEIKGLVPSGEGTSYTMTGKEAYIGTFYGGNPDLSALIGLNVSEINDLFGSELKSTLDSDAFVLSDPNTGIILYCSYAEGEKEPAVKRAYLSPNSSDKHLDRMKWKTLGDYERTADSMGVFINCKTGKASPQIPGVVSSSPALSKKDGTGYRAYLQENGSKVIIWCDGTGRLTDKIVLIEYRPSSDKRVDFSELESQASAKGLPTEGSKPESHSGDKPSVESLTVEADQDPRSKQLTRTAESLLTDKDSTVTVGSELTELLKTAKTKGAEYALMQSVITFISSSSRKNTAELNIDIYNKLLSAEKTAMLTGGGSTKRVDELSQNIQECEARRTAEEVVLINTERDIYIAAGDAPESFDGSLILLVFNPEKLTVDELITAQTAYENKARTGPHVVVNTEEIRSEIELQYKTLGALYSGITAIRSRYTEAAQSLIKAQTDALTGKASEGQVESSRVAFNNVRAELIDAGCNFTASLAKINEMTGGYISLKFHWFEDVLVK